MRRIMPCCLPLALLGASAAGAAPEPKEEVPIHTIPGGVADADGKFGCVTNQDGHVMALDLETGKSLWESKTSGRVVAVTGAWAWAVARDKDKGDVLHVVGLDRGDGRARVESDPVVLPDWVDATPGTGAGRSFAISPRLLGKGLDLYLTWQANAWYWGGAAPSPQVLKAARKHADGVVRVNLETNQVEMLDAAKEPPAGPKVSDALRKEAARNYGEGLTVATAGDDAVAVDLEPAGQNKQKVVLKRWDLATEKPLDPVVLADVGQYNVITLPSAGVTLVRNAAAPPGPSPDEATWTVFALPTGKQITQFTSESAATDFAAVGPRLFYEAKEWFKGPTPGGGGVLPRTLKAVDLKMGKHLWEQAIEGERLPPPPPR